RNSKQQMAVDRYFAARLHHCFGRGKHARHARFVIEMARIDKTVVYLWIGINGDVISDVESALSQRLAVRAEVVSAHFNVVPTYRLSVDLLIEGVPGSL